MAPSTETVVAAMDGHQKLAVVCMTLGADAAAEITRQLPPDDVERISAAISEMDNIDPALVDAVLQEWEEVELAAQSLAGGGPAYARQVLERAFGSEKASSIIHRIQADRQEPQRIITLDSAEPRQLASMLKNEHPQTIAVVLSNTEPESTAPVIQELGPVLGADVLYRAASLEKVSPEILELVNEALSQVSDVYLAGDLSTSGGTQFVASVLGKLPGSRDQLLGGLANLDAEITEEIRSLMFVFEDLGRLDKRSLQSLMQNIDTKDLALSMKVISDSLKEKLESVISQRARSSLRSEMEFLGPVRISEVEDAQKRIIATARSLAEQGEIVLGADDDDEIIE